MPETTYWLGEVCDARPCQVLVAPLTNVGHVGTTDWTDMLNIVGTVQPALEITWHGQVGYIWNDDDIGWRKVTEGRGAATWPHYGLSIVNVVAYGSDLLDPILGGDPLPIVGGLL